MLNVYLPYSKRYITQRFGKNDNPLYASQGLKGHTAYDWGLAWGKPVPNCVENAYCYSVLNRDNPDPSKYRAVYTLIETEDAVYEVSYGHFSKIEAEAGKTYQPGEILGYVGNTGAVYSAAGAVSVAARRAGSRDGSHLHGPQIRECKKVTNMSKGKKYLQTSSGFLKRNGFYYEILNYGNGYNGCISLAPFSTETLASSWKPQEDPVVPVMEVVVEIIENVQELPVEDRTGPLKALQKVLEGVWTYLQGKK